SKGTLAAVSACSANGVAGEIWTTTTSGNSYELVAAFDKQCLDISCASGSNGASALEWTCSNASNHRWQLVALPASEAGAGAPDAGSDARDAAADAVADAPSESASDASDAAVDAAPDVSEAAAPPPPPPADAGGGSSLPTNTTVTLVAQNSGQCVDISISNGQPLQEPC